MLKNIFYAVLLGIGMAACLSQQDEDTETSNEASTQETSLEMPEEASTAAPELFNIAQGRVGAVTIGMPLEELQSNIPAGMALTDTTLLQEGMQSTAYLLRPEGQLKGLLIEQQCMTACQVWRLAVSNSDFKTAKGIAVGSKYSELQQAYAVEQITFEEGNLVALTSEQGISFMLDKGQIPASQLPRLNKENVPANTLIKTILVY